MFDLTLSLYEILPSSAREKAYRVRFGAAMTLVPAVFVMQLGANILLDSETRRADSCARRSR